MQYNLDWQQDIARLLVAIYTTTSASNATASDILWQFFYYESSRAPNLNWQLDIASSDETFSGFL